MMKIVIIVLISIGVQVENLKKFVRDQKLCEFCTVRIAQTNRHKLLIRANLTLCDRTQK